MELDRVIDRIFEELRKAEEKHPGWPMDPVHAAAILAEEAGELVQAALDYTYQGGSEKQMELEAAQCGAMAIRFLTMIGVYDERSQANQYFMIRGKSND